MIILLSLFCVWNFLAILIVAGRVRKLNKHNHGGFTRGRNLEFTE